MEGIVMKELLRFVWASVSCVLVAYFALDYVVNEARRSAGINVPEYKMRFPIPLMIPKFKRD